MTPLVPLAGLDANFLYAETPRSLMHTLKIGVFDDVTCDRPTLMKLVLAGIDRRVGAIGALRRRAVPVPLGLGHPVWADDPDFCASRHVFHRTVRAPGSDADRDRAIADIASRPLRRDRPLWEVWLLDGLADSTLVVVCKLHHALADGAAALQMIHAIAEPLSDPGDAPDGALPSRRQLLSHAIRRKRGFGRRLGDLLSETARSTLAMVRTARGGSDGFPRPFEAPRTVLNGALPAHRQFATASLSLGRIKAVKRALGVTVNDVVLGLAGQAVTQWLEAAGELPDEPLLATVPVGLSRPAGDGGNHLSNIITAIPTRGRDPVQRLLAIRRTTRAAMAAHDVLGKRTMAAWAEFTPPAAFAGALRAYDRLGLADRHRPPVNLIVSNVRGPDLPLTLGGAPLRALYSVGPVLHGIGLNLTAWSYAGRLNVAALAHAELPLPLSELTGRLSGALSAVEDQVGGHVDLPGAIRRRLAAE